MQTTAIGSHVYYDAAVATLLTSQIANCVWSTFGETAEEALQEILKAKQVWLEAARISGKPIPESRQRPFIYQPNARYFTSCVASGRRRT